MSYIGNTPTQQNFVAGADQFSGTGSQTAFTLSRNVNTVFDIFVTVSNVPQDPFTAYTVSGNTLTFDGAPPSGTNNIDVVYRATNVQTFVPTPGVSTQLGLGSASAPSLTFIGDTNTGIYSPAADTIAFTEGGTEVARFNSAGNFGLGTSSPNQRLQINNPAASSSLASFTNANTGSAGGDGSYCGIDTTGNMYVWNQENLPILFGTNNGERMRIDSSGNVGIGTTSPQTKLDVGGTVRVGGSTIGSISLEAGNSTNTGYSGFYNAAGTRVGYIGFGDTTFGINLATDAGSNMPLRFVVTGTERARITSAGEFLVGATGAGGFGLTIYPPLAGNAGTSYLQFNRANTASAGTALQFQNNGTIVGSITHNNTSTAYNTSSDYRLKYDIQPMSGALAKVARLKPCTYRWNVDDSEGEGFIAHELAEVCPSAVIGEKDAVNEDGSIKPQGIDTSFLVATLTAAIQELKAELDATKAEVAALKGAA